MPTNKPERDVDETCHGTDRTDGASPGPAAADKDHPPQAVEAEPTQAWGALISAQAQHPSLSLLGGRACIWQDPLTGSLALVPGSARALQLCRLEVQKPGPAGGQPSAVLSALSSHALQLDGKSLAAGERVPLRSGSELVVLPSFGASSSLQERRSCALFLFMPADLGAYDERAGAAADAVGPPSPAAAGQSSAVVKGAAGSGVGVAGAGVAPAHTGSGGGGGDGARGNLMQRVHRAALLGSLLQRASLGAGAGRSAASPDDAYFSAAAVSHPARRPAGESAAGVSAQQQQRQQQRQQQHVQRQALGQGTEGWLPWLGRLRGMPPHLLRTLLRAAPPGAPQRWLLAAAAADVAADADPVAQGLKRFRAAMAAPAGLGSAAILPPRTQQQQHIHDNNPRCTQQVAASAAAVATGRGEIHGANWAELARLGQSIAAAAAVAAAAATPEPDVLEGFEGWQLSAASAGAAQKPRLQPQRHPRQRLQAVFPAEAGEAAVLPELDAQLNDLWRGLMMGGNTEHGPADEPEGATRVVAAAAAAGPTPRDTAAAPWASRASVKACGGPARRGVGGARTPGNGGGGGRGLRWRHATYLAGLLAATEPAGAGAEPRDPLEGPPAGGAAAAVAPSATPIDDSLPGLGRRLQELRGQFPLTGGLPAGLSASAPASPSCARTAEGVRAQQARLSGGPLLLPPPPTLLQDQCPQPPRCSGADQDSVAPTAMKRTGGGAALLGAGMGALKAILQEALQGMLPPEATLEAVGAVTAGAPTETASDRATAGDMGAGAPRMAGGDVAGTAAEAAVAAGEGQNALRVEASPPLPSPSATPDPASLPHPLAQAAAAATEEDLMAAAGLGDLPAAGDPDAVPREARVSAAAAVGDAAMDNSGAEGDGAGGSPAGLGADPDADAMVTDFLAGLICSALEEAGAVAAAATGTAAPGGGTSDTGAVEVDAATAIAADNAGVDTCGGSSCGAAGDKAAAEYGAAAPMAVEEVPRAGVVVAAGVEGSAAAESVDAGGLEAAMDAGGVVSGSGEQEAGGAGQPADMDMAMDASPAAASKAAAGQPSALPQQDAAAAAAAQQTPRPQQQQAPPPTGGPAQPPNDPMRKRVAAFKAELTASALTRPEALTTTFDNMPYYVGSGTKERLLATALLHLRHSRFAAFTADLAAMSPRLLLSGPFGSDLYQQAIVSAVAASCGASLLVLDRVALGLEGEPGLAAGAGMAGAGGAAGLGDAADDGRDPDLDLDDDDDSLDLGMDPSRFVSRWQPSGLKRRRLLGIFGAGVGVGGGPGGGGGDGKTPGGGAPAGGRAGTAGGEKGGVAGPRPLRKGDRVRFWGSGGAGGGGAGLGGAGGLAGPLGGSLLGGLPGGGHVGYLVSAMGHRAAAAAARAAGEGLPGGAVAGAGGGGGPASAGSGGGGGGGSRGPALGSTGRVVLAFEDNPRKVGVRFDSPVPGGLDLGGACEEGHGFFCAAGELALEGSRQDEEAEGAAVAALFELAGEVAAAGPVVVHIRDAERVVVGNLERFNRVRRALEALPPGVLVVASHAPRSGGAGRGLGAGLGGGWGGGGGSRLQGVMEPMLLLDPMFGSRLADKVRGLTGSDDPRDSRSVRALLKAFPNRVTLHPPHGEPAASEWRAALDRDVGTLRERANRRALAGLMSRCGVECADLEAVVIRDQALSADAVERVVGWAVAVAVQRAAALTAMTAAASASTVPGAAAAAAGASQRTPEATAEAAASGGPAAAPTAAVDPASAATPPSAGPPSGPGFVWGPAADEELLVRGGLLQITAADVASAVGTLKAVAAERVPPSKQGLQDVQVEGEFEKKLLAEVVPPEELGVSFDSIGALEAVKETLREVVMLPLQRPELFTRGTLTKPTKGVLLFGPPGTGKTMLAKAVASECGANFLYVSLSSVTSKWFGEAEKYIKAVFTLAHKIAPSVIFVDEVDSLLGKRTGSSSEHEASRKMKNEFMAHWDGLKTRQKDRVMVLAATNRPMDLDEAVIRRMPRRIMVDLPDTGNRVKILKVLLKDENLAPGFPLEELAALTEGYSGSDLKNMCVAAAYRPIRELITAERADAEAVKARLAVGPGTTAAADAESASAEEGRRLGLPPLPGAVVARARAASRQASPSPSPVLVAAPSRGVTPEAGALPAAVAAASAPPVLRALALEDFRAAMQQVGPSVASDQGSLMNELRRWNEAYGEGGKRKADTLTYFL